MKAALFALAAPAVLASPLALELFKRDCTANNCLRAVRGNPDIAAPFCYTTLGRITTETDVITAYTTETTTVTTIVATVTDYAATITTIVLPPHNPLAKRTKGPEDTVSSIIKACSTDDAKISSACSCFLGDSTSTVTEVTTTTLPVTVTEVVTDTATVDIPTLVVTSTCSPWATPVIKNGWFEAGTIDPWATVAVDSGENAGTGAIVNDFVTPGHDHAFKASLPGNIHKVTKVKIAQDLVTCPGVKYSLSFWYKFSGLRGGSSDLVTLIDGTTKLDIDGSLWNSIFWTFTTTTFTATSTTTNLEFDFVLAKGLGSEAIYLDGVTIVPLFI